MSINKYLNGLLFIIKMNFSSWIKTKFLTCFAIVILFQFVKTACGEGCLSCQSNNCTVCDVYFNFVLSNGTCIPANITNCLIPSNTTACQRCKEGFYKTNTSACLVPTLQDPNCRIFLNSTNCSVCFGNYYANNGTCFPVSKLINGCAEYETNTTCKKCLLNNLSPDRTSCVAIPPSQDLNCLYSFSPLYCLNCTNNSIYNSSFYLSNFTRTVEFFALKRKRSLLTRFDYANVPVCQSIGSPNSQSLSKTFSSTVGSCNKNNIFLPESCYSCSNGQVWSDSLGSCTPFPLTVSTKGSLVSNCALTQNSNQCAVCNEGYYLNLNVLNCTQHQVIVNNCQIMSQRINNVCIFCKTGFFLALTGGCSARAVIDPNCLTYSYFNDFCAVCKTNFIFNIFGNTCVTATANCITYQFNFTGAFCVQCSNNFNLNGTSCIANVANVVILNCATYDPISGNCTKCNSGSVLVQDKSTSAFIARLICTTTPSGLSNCQLAVLIGSTYTCLSCQDNSLLLSTQTTCVLNSSMAQGCLRLSNSGVCEFCSPGYFLSLDTNLCYSGIDGNCAYYQPQAISTVSTSTIKCLTCISGFILMNNVCVLASSGVGQNNCILPDGNGNCALCAAGFGYSFNINNNLINAFKCQPNTKFLSIDPNCISFKSTTDFFNFQTYSCIACKRNFYLDSVSNLCVACNSGLCTFVSSNLNVVQTALQPCLISFGGNCHQYNLGNVPYYTNVAFTAQTQAMVFYNNQFYANVWSISATSHLSSATFLTNPLTSVFFSTVQAQQGMLISDITCPKGFSRDYTVSTLTPTSNDCNVRIFNCLTRSNVLMNSPWRIKASCYACRFSKLVFIADGAILISNWAGISTELPPNYSGVYIPSVICASSSFATSGSVSNCGAYLFSFSSSMTFNCIACLPGYQAVFSNSFITACNLIQNCALTRSDEICEFCSPSYALSFDSRTCIQTSITNCFQMNQSQNCLICANGYFLNGNICVKIINFECNVYGKNGCLECLLPSHIATHDISFGFTNPITCTQSVAQPTRSNCLLVDYKGLCARCASGFTANVFGECFSTLSFTNCVIIDPISQNCALCNVGYIQDLLTNSCLSATIGNQTNTCSGLYPFGFLINQGKQQICSAVPYANCDLIDTYKIFNLGTIDCARCSNGFMLSTQANSQSFCLAVKPFSDCALHKNDNLGNFRCQTCNTGFYVNSLGDCQSQLVIPSCATFSTNSPGCSVCQTNYFISNGFCLPRQYLHPNCVIYFTYSDDCQAYDPAYQYISNYTAIITTPPSASSQISSNAVGYQGVNYCIQYSYPTICSLCASNSFLDITNNVCILVSLIIQYCQVYTIGSVCIQCQPGYLLMPDNTCQQISATNCSSYANSNTCSTCPPQALFLDSSGNCGENPNVNNCTVYQTPTICLVCNAGLYWSNGTCNNVTTLIPQCLSYDQNQACTSCSNGYYLFGGVCNLNPNYDINCATFAFSSTQCSICAEGYALVSGTCIKCGTNYQTCAICSLTDLQTCLVCKSGYNMLLNGSCVQNTRFISDQPALIISTSEK